MLLEEIIRKHTQPAREESDSGLVDTVYRVLDAKEHRRVSQNGRWREVDDDTVEDLHTGIKHRIDGVNTPETEKHFLGLHGKQQGAGTGILFDLLDQAGDDTHIHFIDTGERHKGRQISNLRIGGKDVSEYLIENHYGRQAFDPDGRYDAANQRAQENPLSASHVTRPYMSQGELEAHDKANHKTFSGGRYFRNALNRGWDQGVAMNYAAAEVLGELTGTEWLERWGHEGIIEKFKEVAENPPQVKDYTEAEGQVGKYVLEALGEELPQLAMDFGALVTGGFGAAALGRSVLKKLSAEQKSKLIRRSAKGAAYGSFASQSVGEVQLELKDQGLESPGTALGVGALNAAIDFKAAEYLLSPLFKRVQKLHANGRLNRKSAALAVAASGVQGFGVESVTEFIQTLNTKLAAQSVGGKPYDSAEFTKEYIDAAIKGGIVGGTLSGGAGLLGQLGARIGPEYSDKSAKAHEEINTLGGNIPDDPDAPDDNGGGGSAAEQDVPDNPLASVNPDPLASLDKTQINSAQAVEVTDKEGQFKSRKVVATSHLSAEVADARAHLEEGDQLTVRPLTERETAGLMVRADGKAYQERAAKAQATRKTKETGQQHEAVPLPNGGFGVVNRELQQVETPEAEQAAPEEEQAIESVIEQPEPESTDPFAAIQPEPEVETAQPEEQVFDPLAAIQPEPEVETAQPEEQVFDPLAAIQPEPKAENQPLVDPNIQFNDQEVTTRYDRRGSVVSDLVSFEREPYRAESLRSIVGYETDDETTASERKTTFWSFMQDRPGFADSVRQKIAESYPDTTLLDGLQAKGFITPPEHAELLDWVKKEVEKDDGQQGSEGQDQAASSRGGGQETRSQRDNGANPQRGKGSGAGQNVQGDNDSGGQAQDAATPSPETEEAIAATKTQLENTHQRFLDRLTNEVYNEQTLADAIKRYSGFAETAQPNTIRWVLGVHYQAGIAIGMSKREAAAITMHQAEENRRGDNFDGAVLAEEAFDSEPENHDDADHTYDLDAYKDYEQRLIEIDDGDLDLTEAGETFADYLTKTAPAAKNKIEQLRYAVNAIFPINKASTVAYTPTADDVRSGRVKGYRITKSGLIARRDNKQLFKLVPRDAESYSHLDGLWTTTDKEKAKEYHLYLKELFPNRIYKLRDDTYVYGKTGEFKGTVYYFVDMGKHSSATATDENRLRHDKIAKSRELGAIRARGLQKAIKGAMAPRNEQINGRDKTEAEKERDLRTVAAFRRYKLDEKDGEVVITDEPADKNPQYLRLPDITSMGMELLHAADIQHPERFRHSAFAEGLAQLYLLGWKPVKSIADNAIIAVDSNNDYTRDSLTDHSHHTAQSKVKALKEEFHQLGEEIESLREQRKLVYRLDDHEPSPEPKEGEGEKLEFLRMELLAAQDLWVDAQNVMAEKLNPFADKFKQAKGEYSKIDDQLHEKFSQLEGRYVNGQSTMTVRQVEKINNEILALFAKKEQLANAMAEARTEAKKIFETLKKEQAEADQRFNNFEYKQKLYEEERRKDNRFRPYTDAEKDARKLEVERLKKELESDPSNLGLKAKVRTLTGKDSHKAYRKYRQGGFSALIAEKTKEQEQVRLKLGNAVDENTTDQQALSDGEFELYGISALDFTSEAGIEGEGIDTPDYVADLFGEDKKTRNTVRRIDEETDVIPKRNKLKEKWLEAERQGKVETHRRRLLPADLTKEEEAELSTVKSEGNTLSQEDRGFVANLLSAINMKMPVTLLTPEAFRKHSHFKPEHEQDMAQLESGEKQGVYYGDFDRALIVIPEIGRNDRQSRLSRSLTIAHELAHGLQDHFVDGLTPNQAKRLRAAYEKDVKFYKRVGQPAPEFQEWFADKLARHLVDKSLKPRSFVEKLARDIASKMRALFKAVFNLLPKEMRVRFRPNKTVNELADELAATHGMGQLIYHAYIPKAFSQGTTQAAQAELAPLAKGIKTALTGGKDLAKGFFHLGRYILDSSYQLRLMGENGKTFSQQWYINAGESVKVRNPLTGALLKGGFLFRSMKERGRLWSSFNKMQAGDLKVSEHFEKRNIFKPHPEVKKGKEDILKQASDELYQRDKKLGDKFDNPFAQAVSDFFRQMYKGYLKEALPTLGHIPDYVPIVTNTNAMINNRTKYFDIAVKHKFNEYMERYEKVRVEQGRSISDKEYDKVRDGLMEAAKEHTRHVMHRIEYGNGIPELALTVSEEVYGPGFSNRRERDFFTTPMIDELSKEGFLETDLMKIVFNYVSNSTRRAEFERTWGGYDVLEGITNPAVTKDSANRENSRERIAAYYAWNVAGMQFRTDNKKKRIGLDRIIPLYRRLGKDSKSSGHKFYLDWLRGLPIKEQEQWQIIKGMIDDNGAKFYQPMLKILKDRGVMKEGDDGQLYAYSTNAGMMQMLDAIQNEITPGETGRGAGEANRLKAEEITRAMLGQVGLSMAPEVHSAMSNMMAYQSVLVLMFSTLSSFPDIAGGILRNRDAAGMFNALGVTARISFMKFTDPAKYGHLVEQAKARGLIGQRVSKMVLQDMYGSSFTTDSAQKVLDYLFHWNQQERWTDFTRVVNYGVADSSIRRWVELAENNDDAAKEYLEEINLDAKTFREWDGKAFALEDQYALSNMEEGSQEYNELKRKLEVREAVDNAYVRFVEESVIRPNAAHRPTWASDPRFMLLWHLKSFFYSYGKVIVNPFLRHLHNQAKKAMKGNRGARGIMLYGSEIPFQAIPLLIAGTVLFGLAALGWEMKEFVQYTMFGKEGRTDRMEWDDYVLELTGRSGVTGAFELVFDGLWGYGDIDRREAKLLGPTIEWFMTWADTDVDLAHKLFRSTPVLNQLTGAKQELSQ